MRLDLDIYRTWETPASVCGELWLRGLRWFYTLEPARVNPVIPGHPCIPAGTYRVILSKSPRLGYICPEVLDVPGRSEIRWHIGNFPQNVEGCTAVGETHEPDFVGESAVAFKRMMKILVTTEYIFVTYHDAPAPAPALADSSSKPSEVITT
jgi:hypothetical protein